MERNDNMKDRETIVTQNRAAWSARAYKASCDAHGSPSKEAERLKCDPKKKLERLIPYIGEVEGLRVGNPLGSNGRIGVALALLGARVTVFDISPQNRQFAVELANAAGVEIEYLVGDFINVAATHEAACFDLLVMELGILHYFSDIKAYVRSLFHLLKPGGRVVLNEFHPIMKKSFSVRDGEVIFSGDYFRSEVEENPVAYRTLLKENGEGIPNCLVRYWTLGEVVTEFAAGGLQIKKLVEFPSWVHDKLPCLFTLVAERHTQQDASSNSADAPR